MVGSSMGLPSPVQKDHDIVHFNLDTLMTLFLYDSHKIDQSVLVMKLIFTKPDAMNQILI